MRYAGLKKNDIVDCDEGICVSFWTQGCPHRCPECHNPQTWDFNGGKEFTDDILQEIIKSISANGVLRNFSVLGGEPLCPTNIPLTKRVVLEVRKNYPDIKIYIWTGYLLEDLQKNPEILTILDNIDVLIDGPYIKEQRNITLPLRGSENQRVLYKNKNF